MTAPLQESQTLARTGVAAVLLLYLIGVVTGWPQDVTARVAAADSNHAGADHDHAPHETAHPPLGMLAPFAVLLGAIAVLPLIPHASHWWESNLHRFYVAGGLAAITMVYYLFAYDHPVAGHWPVDHLSSPSAAGLHWRTAGTILGNSILAEYIPFIVLLFSLYVISGGIRIEGNLRPTSLTNTIILGIGAALASFVGTTGAAMLLIRLLLETNRRRKHVRHTVVLFIFIVCNCGGCLLPLGDPPLFLGYLFGVPFLWTMHLWPEWLAVNLALLAIYFAWDRLWFVPREADDGPPGAHRVEWFPGDNFGKFPSRTLARRFTDRRQPGAASLRFLGLWPNALLLAGVVAAIALLDPGKPLPWIGWRPWVFLREFVQLSLVLVSLVRTPKGLRGANEFNYHPIVEVAVLFLGVFICMQPALQILHVEGPSLGVVTPTQFFWATGGLSAVLDNAPTYAVFFETARSLGAGGTAVENVRLIAGVPEPLLIAISFGAVFMGAMSYIGNGPNFMVKSIAEKSGIRMPSFFGYIAYSAAILLPVLILVELLFIR